MLPELMNLRQTAEYLNISEGTLSFLRHKGTAPAAIKIGRALRWRRSDLDTWLEDKFAQAEADAAAKRDALMESDAS